MGLAPMGNSAKAPVGDLWALVLGRREMSGHAGCTLKARRLGVVALMPDWEPSRTEVGGNLLRSFTWRYGCLTGPGNECKDAR